MSMREIAKRLNINVGDKFVDVTKYSNVGTAVETVSYREGTIIDITNNLLVVEFKIPKHSGSCRNKLTECFNIGDILSRSSVLDEDYEEEVSTKPPLNLLGIGKEEKMNILGSSEYPVFSR